MDNQYVPLDVHEEYAKRVAEENDRQNHRLTKLEKAVDEADHKAPQDQS